jgi:peptidoglycan/LPS O-acetylase OafA/YrhL
MALGGGPLVRFLSTGSAQYLGQASYSMYILHVPLLWWYGSPEIFLRGYIGAGVVALVYLVGMVLISAACFEWIEKPWNRRIRDFARTRAVH